MNKELANRDSSESKFHNHCPPLGKAVPSQWALPGRSSIFCPFGKKTRPNDRLSCGEGFAGPVKLLLAAAELNSGWSVKEKSKWNHFLPLESLFLCTHLLLGKEKAMHWKHPFQVRFIKWCVPREWWVVTGWSCVSPSTSQRPFGGADAEQGWCDSTGSPTFHSRSQVWIDCVISYQCSSYRRSHWAWHPSSSIWSPQFPASGSSSPCVLFSFRMSHFSPPPGSPHLESLASPSSLSITCQSCLTSLYLPFPGPFMTLNDFPAPSPDFLLWSRWRTAWTDTLAPLFFPTVV